MAHMRRVTAALAGAGLTVATVLVPVGAAGAHETYIVQPGDSLSVIARDFGITTEELAAENGITDHHLIRVGQSLSIPHPSGDATAPVIHEVAPGDTVSEIARDYGVAAADIIAINGLDDPNRIKVGQKLELPAGADPESTLAQLAAHYPALPSSITDNPERLALLPSFERWAAHYGVAPDLLMAMAYQESGWQAAVVSSAGAIGIGQLLPSTATWVATDLIGIPELDPYNPDDNIRMSARFLLWLLNFHGSETLAIAGYFQGPTSVLLRGLLPETEVYVASVTAGRTRFLRS